MFDPTCFANGRFGDLVHDAADVVLRLRNFVSDLVLCISEIVFLVANGNKGT